MLQCPLCKTRCKNFKGMIIHFARMHKNDCVDDYFSISSESESDDLNTCSDPDSDSTSSTDQRQSTHKPPKSPASKAPPNKPVPPKFPQKTNPYAASSSQSGPSPSGQKLQYPHKCWICSSSFNKEGALKLHLASTHPICEHCQTHVHIDDNAHRCWICTKCNGILETDHICTKTCQFCTVIYKADSTHATSCQRQYTKCPVCLTYINRSYFKAHIVNCGKCQNCSRRFLTEAHLKGHICFTCTHCSKEFKDKSIYEKHEEECLCPTCTLPKEDDHDCLVALETHISELKKRRIAEVQNKADAKRARLIKKVNDTRIASFKKKRLLQILETDIKFDQLLTDGLQLLSGYTQKLEEFKTAETQCAEQEREFFLFRTTHLTERWNQYLSAYQNKVEQNMISLTNYQAILGLTQEANESEISKKYREVMLECHSDKIVNETNPFKKIYLEKKCTHVNRLRDIYSSK